MSRTFLSAGHLRTWDQVSCKYTHSSRLSHDTLHRFLVLVLPEVEKRRSGEADMSGIANIRRPRRESHGKIWTPRRHSLKGYVSSGAGGSDSSKLRSPFSRSRRSSTEAAWWAQLQRLTWNQRYRHQYGIGCERPPHPWLHQSPSHTILPQSPKSRHVFSFNMSLFFRKVEGTK